MKIIKNHLMKEYSNMKIGGIAKNYFIVENKEEIKNILDNYSNIFIIGNGTNTLIKDGDLNTNFLSLKKLNKIKKTEDNIIEVQAGVVFSDLINYMEKENLTGLENLSGIPGTVGGLIYMNGGAYGSEIFDCILEIEVLDENRKIKKIKKENIKFSYRNTEIQEKNWIVISASFKFEKGFKKETVLEIQKKRETRHPLELPNLGSSFKNPKDNFAAKLIIKSGVQGHRIGDAQVSEKHPNFIVNLGDASYEDVINLIAYVKGEVLSKTGVNLEEEIVIINE